MEDVEDVRSYLKSERESDSFAEGSVAAPSPIQVQFERQHHILERMDNDLAKLLDRLGPVLGMDSPRVSRENADKPNICPLAHRMYLANERMEEMHDVLMSIHDRLEL